MAVVGQALKFLPRNENKGLTPMATPFHFVGRALSRRRGKRSWSGRFTRRASPDGRTHYRRNAADAVARSASFAYAIRACRRVRMNGSRSSFGASWTPRRPRPPKPLSN
jgi:hypothetical protein